MTPAGQPAPGMVSRWGPLALWLSLPLTAAPSFADALDGRSHPVSLTATIGLWALWLVGLVATLVPSTVSLTTIRILMPAAVVAAGWAAVVVPDGADAAQSVALGVTSLGAVLSLSAGVGDVFINGSSYGDERRMPLRPPGPVVMGPIELVWALMVAGAFAGPLLLAARQWVAGSIVTVLAIIVCVAGARILHQLTKRWLVFVPAGIVLVDRTVLVDAMLTMRQRIASIGPSPVDSNAVDLTADALGLALELRLTEPDVIIPMPTRRDRSQVIDPVEVTAVRFTPTRPGRVLEIARERRLTVG